MCLDMAGGGELLAQQEEDQESLDLVASDEDMVVDGGDFGAREQVDKVVLPVPEALGANVQENVEVGDLGPVIQGECTVCPIDTTQAIASNHDTGTDPSPTTSKSTTPVLAKKKTGKKFVNPVRLPSHNFTDIVLSSDDDDSDREPNVQSKLAEKEREIKRVMELIEQKTRAEKKKASLKKKEATRLAAETLPSVKGVGDEKLSELETRSKALQQEITSNCKMLADVEQVLHIL
jgi:hypothetical protein